MGNLWLILDTDDMWDTGAPIKGAALGCRVGCNGQTCLPYVGEVPKGYSSLEDWYIKESGRLCYWHAMPGDESEGMGGTAYGLTKIEPLDPRPGMETAARERLTPTAADETLATVDSATLFYYPEHQMVFCRLQMTMVEDLPKGYYQMAVVDSKLPAFIHPLAVTSGKYSADGYVTSSGGFYVRAHETVPAGQAVRLAGWWVVASENV